MALALFSALIHLAGSGCGGGTLRSARRALDAGDFEGAARLYGEALEDSPEDASLWWSLAQAELLAERPTRAREAFEEVARLRPADPRSRVEIGFTWELQRRYDRALGAYLSAEAAAPERAYPHRITGTRLLRWGEAAAAAPHLERAVALDPDHEETWHALGQALYEAGDARGAEEAFRRGLARLPESRRLRLSLAAVLINAGQHAAALTVYDEVVERTPGFAPAHVGRGILLHELGRCDDAEAAFVRAVEVAAEPARYRRRLAEYRRLLGQEAAERDIPEP